MGSLSPTQSSINTAAVIATTAAATVALSSLLRIALYPRHPQILRGPLKTVIPTLSDAELAALDYTPDAFPGARDVETPVCFPISTHFSPSLTPPSQYGSIRVYEFGPPKGRKVLLIHGISTSCQTLTHIAHALAGKGCRVMLFDLFGRGFSDTPSDLPHDARLYVAQTLLALASSPLAWTGGEAKVRVVGYSMGGGIAAHFVASLPGMVDSLALLAPAGLIRREKFGVLAHLVYGSGVVPDRVLGALTRRRLERPIAEGVRRRGEERKGEGEEREALLRRQSSDGGKGKDPLDAALAEAADDTARDLEPANRLEAKVLRYVQWMVRFHRGFIPAFMASLRDAPLMGQHEAYARLAKTEVPVSMVFGRGDTIVDEKQYWEDGLPLMGEERVMWRVVSGGHDFPMTHAREAVEVLEEFWGRA
jgi:pimeloyl-ACP methyl ester carboxylesterase